MFTDTGTEKTGDAAVRQCGSLFHDLDPLKRDVDRGVGDGIAVGEDEGDGAGVIPVVGIVVNPAVQFRGDGQSQQEQEEAQQSAAYPAPSGKPKKWKPIQHRREV